MQEDLKNNPNIDPSGLFNTYSAHPNTDDRNGVVWGPYPLSPRKEDQKHDNESNSVKIVRIVVDGFVRIIKIFVWCIAVFGWLFITALATNTMNRAVEILNANIGTHISISGEVSKASVTVPQKQQITPWLTSNALNTPPSDNTPEAIAKKRRAILEAKKAAKILEEKQKALEQVSK